MQDEPVEALVEVLNKEINSPLTSSCGRLFDAVAAICGIRKRIRYEAQAAIELMQHSESIKGNIFPKTYIEYDTILKYEAYLFVEDLS